MGLGYGGCGCVVDYDKGPQWVNTCEFHKKQAARLIATDGIIEVLQREVFNMQLRINELERAQFVSK